MHSECMYTRMHEDVSGLQPQTKHGASPYETEAVHASKKKAIVIATATTNRLTNCPRCLPTQIGVKALTCQLSQLAEVHRALLACGLLDVTQDWKPCAVLSVSALEALQSWRAIE